MWKVGRITVAARAEGQTLVLTVRDTGSGLQGTLGTAPMLASHIAPHIASQIASHIAPHVVLNTAPDSAPNTAAGSQFGLAQVRERLATLHGALASLALEPAADGQGGNKSLELNSKIPGVHRRGAALYSSH